MAIASVTLKNFTVFEDARFDLCPGVNVVIGTNATGKTHAMKAMYCVLRASLKEMTLPTDFAHKFESVFRPDGHEFLRLVRRQALQAGGSAEMFLAAGGSEHVELRFYREQMPTVFSKKSMKGVQALYLPSREVLSMFEGFIAAYQSRELSFDETFFDLCVALDATPLKGERAEQVAPLLATIEAILGGKVIRDGSRFYVQPPGGERYEAHLVAEGLRRIATLAHLVGNGSIATGSVLFWDEPETNLNPRLITQLVDVLVAFARRGVQVVLATHDYLLSHRLSLLSEYGQNPAAPIRFFGLARGEPEGPVTVTSGDTLASLPDNPIVDEFARHYDFERSLFDRSHGG